MVVVVAVVVAQVVVVVKVVIEVVQVARRPSVLEDGRYSPSFFWMLREGARRGRRGWLAFRFAGELPSRLLLCFLFVLFRFCPLAAPRGGNSLQSSLVERGPFYKAFCRTGAVLQSFL